jgi:hypothetical protein
MTGDAMCMVIVLAEPPVVERHMAAADTRAAVVGIRAEEEAGMTVAGAGTEPQN